SSTGMDEVSGNGLEKSPGMDGNTISRVGISTTDAGDQGGSMFVAGSSVMKGLMKQVDELSRLSQNILITGERSTGKMTIADQMARKAAVLKSGTQVWSLDLREIKGSRR